MLNIVQEGTNELRTVLLSGDATVRNVRDLKEALLEALRSAREVKVVFGNVETVDVSMMQLLCSAHLAAAEAGKNLTVEGTDREPVKQLLEEAGFFRHIGCHENIRRSCLWNWNG